MFKRSRQFIAFKDGSVTAHAIPGASFGKALFSLFRHSCVQLFVPSNILPGSPCEQGFSLLSAPVNCRVLELSCTASTTRPSERKRADEQLKTTPWSVHFNNLENHGTVRLVERCSRELITLLPSDPDLQGLALALAASPPL